MMLVHIGQTEVAERIHNAWLRTIEDGVQTFDLAKGGAAVGTEAFADAVIARLGEILNEDEQAIAERLIRDYAATIPSKQLIEEIGLAIAVHRRAVVGG